MASARDQAGSGVGKTDETGTLKEGGRDGTLIVVSRDLTRAVKASDIAPTLQRVLEDWQRPRAAPAGACRNG